MEDDYDVLIAGAGPAGMTAAIYAARKALRVAMLTDTIGGQVARTGEIENYTGFEIISGSDLVERFHEHARRFDVPFYLGEIVRRVESRFDGFAVHCESGNVRRARAVIIATGRRYRRLGVPGEDEFIGRGVSYCFVCDAPFFRGKRVAVIGGGNAAFSAARDLLKLDAHVTMVNAAGGWQADSLLVGLAARHPNAVLFDRAEVVAIAGDTRVRTLKVSDLVAGDTADFEVDGVFVEIGGSANSAMVDGLAAVDELGEIVIDCHCRTSVRGLFAAGDVTTAPFKQIAVSVGEGAKAALSAYDYLNGISAGEGGLECAAAGAREEPGGGG